MSSENHVPGSVTKAIAAFTDHDEQSAQLIWERFFDRLCRFAEKKIYHRHRRYMDPEDIAGSAMYALMEGLKQGHFYSVNNRDQLWQMVAMIAARKAINKAKFLDRDKRGGKQVVGESALNDLGLSNLETYILAADDPAKFVEFEMTCRELLLQLPDDDYREIALMRMAGFANQEIGKKLSCSTRTIDRKLNTIREIWDTLDLETH
jgi:DNA-directed RNA polymerase specialized sigma24 family protein